MTTRKREHKYKHYIVGTGVPLQKVYFSEVKNEGKWGSLGWGCPIWLWNISPNWLRCFYFWIMKVSTR